MELHRKEGQPGKQEEQQQIRRSLSVHLDHYAGKRLPYVCLSASGLRQQMAKLESDRLGEPFSVIDASGGYASACLGAGHPVVVRALSEALMTHGYVTDEVASAERTRCIDYLFGPDGLWSDRFPASRYHICGRNSGSEGMELALRLVLESGWDARNMAPKAGRESRRHLLAFEGAWHGWTSGVTGLLNRRHYRIGLPNCLAAGPHGLEVHFLPFGEAGLLEEFFHERGRDLAAVFVEPIQGDAGILVPPPGYLSGLATLCRMNDVLLVADEVLTFGKTGRFFAMEDDGPVATDITVIGKSLGFGALPVSLVIARSDLKIRPCGAVSTNDLRPLACSLLREGVGYVSEQGLVKRAGELGEHLRHHLAVLVANFPSVFGEARGLGYLLGVELTENAAKFVQELRTCLLEAGVYVEFMAGAGRRSGGLRYLFPAMRVAPPLIADESDLDAIARALRSGLRAFMARNA